jgi:putative MFS transporter
MGPFQRRILIAAGLCFASDSMEILLLSFLAVILQVEWDLTESQTATITSSVFVGAMIGTLVLGPLADHIGRKPVFTITAAIICFFGFATAAANSFPAILVCRFCVGLGVGGLTVPFDTLAEFVPASHRGTNLLAIEYFWTGGTLLVPVLAYFSLGEADEGERENGWRIFVVLCGIPCLASTILGLFYVPESPRWLMTKGKHGKALGILRLAATQNGKDPMELFPLNTQLIDDEESEENGSFCNLLAPAWRRITLLLWGTWAGM